MRIARVGILLAMTVAVATTMVACSESPIAPGPIASGPPAAAPPTVPATTACLVGQVFVTENGSRRPPGNWVWIGYYESYEFIAERTDAQGRYAVCEVPLGSVGFGVASSDGHCGDSLGSTQVLPGENRADFDLTGLLQCTSL